MPKSSGSSVRGRRVARNARRTPRARKIDVSDIPERSESELRTMKRVGRPPLGSSARQLIAIRIDPEVLRWTKREAKRRGVGYQTLINEMLAARTTA